MRRPITAFRSLGLSHTIDEEQVDMVLSRFEATTESIRGIEKKVERMSVHAVEAQEYHEKMATHLHRASVLVNRFDMSVHDQADSLGSYIDRTWDRLTALVEEFEICVGTLDISAANRQMLRELGPLLVPTVVLVVIITASNCYFGFAMANDPVLAQRFVVTGNRTLTHSVSGPEGDSEEAFNILNIFAIFHITLIGLAIAYILGEIYQQTRRKLKTKKKQELPNSGLASQSDAVDEDVSEEVEVEGADDGSNDEVLPEGTRTVSPASPRLRRRQRDSESPVRSISSSLPSQAGLHTPMAAMLRTARNKYDAGIRQMSDSLKSRHCPQTGAGTSESSSTTSL